MAARNAAENSARARLLSAANELFYDEGVHTVGVERVISHAGVAKASLYNTYGSKEALVRAYLDARHEGTTTHITDYIARYDTPREELLGVFEAQGEIFAAPGFRGCAFVSATAEANPGTQVEEAADAYRAWIRGLFAGLAAQAGDGEPDALARKLQMLYDGGGGLSAHKDNDPEAAQFSRAAAEALLDAALS